MYLQLTNRIYLFSCYFKGQLLACLAIWVCLIQGGFAADIEKEKEVIGCWTRVPPTESDNFLSFCFKKGGTVYGAVLEKTGEGQELDVEAWYFESDRIIRIDKASCAYDWLGHARFRLKHCKFEGLWNRDK